MGRAERLLGANTASDNEVYTSHNGTSNSSSADSTASLCRLTLNVCGLPGHGIHHHKARFPIGQVVVEYNIKGVGGMQRTKDNSTFSFHK